MVRFQSNALRFLIAFKQYVGWRIAADNCEWWIIVFPKNSNNDSDLYSEGLWYFLLGERIGRSCRTSKCKAQPAKPRGQKATKPQNQNSTNPGIQRHVVFNLGEAASRWASEPEPVIQWASETLSQSPSSVFYRKRNKVCICQRCFQK